MKIIVGLGNPGKKYAHTRHNVGFMILDRLAEKEKIGFKKSFKLRSFLAKKTDGSFFSLVKPGMFMNNSGRVVHWFVKTYGVSPDDLLVVYDDMDLDTGRIKFAQKGSSAGHRGMESVIDALGTGSVSRLRIGISKPAREDAVEYVLHGFSAHERPIIEETIDEAVSACQEWIREGITYVMQKYNTKKERQDGTHI